MFTGIKNIQVLVFWDLWQFDFKRITQEGYRNLYEWFAYIGPIQIRKWK